MEGYGARLFNCHRWGTSWRVLTPKVYTGPMVLDWEVISYENNEGEIERPSRRGNRSKEIIKLDIILDVDVDVGVDIDIDESINKARGSDS